MRQIFNLMLQKAQIAYKVLNMFAAKVALVPGLNAYVDSNGEIVEVQSKSEAESISLFHVYILCIMKVHFPSISKYQLLEPRSKNESLKMLIAHALNMDNYKSFKNYLMSLGLYREALNYFDLDANFDPSATNIITKRLICMLICNVYENCN